MAVVTLRQTGAAEADAASLLSVGRTQVAVRDATFLLGPGLMPAFNATLLGYLAYRSGLVPRLIPAMGLIGAPLLASSTLGMMFGVNESGSVWEVCRDRPDLLLGAVTRTVDDVHALQPVCPHLGRAFC
jgi:hypothetical protein